MSPALGALLARLDLDATYAADMPAGVFDDDLARELAISLLTRVRPAPEAIDAVLSAIIHLHQRQLDGQAVSDKDWRSVRRQAVLLSEQEKGSARQAAALAEAAAWPIAGSRSGLCDIVTALSPVSRAVAIAATGWTAEDEKQAHAVMADLAKRHPDVDRTSRPSLFATVEPDLERRFRHQLDAANINHLSFTRSVFDELLHLARQRDLSSSPPEKEVPSYT